MQTHFPHLSPLLETYYLTCLLHDLGTTADNMHGTHMSFEYFGAFKALNFLRDNGAPKDQAEAVSEAIIRHADLGETGTLTSLGMLIQLSTVFGKLPPSLSSHLIQNHFAQPRHTRTMCDAPSSPCLDPRDSDSDLSNCQNLIQVHFEASWYGVLRESLKASLHNAAEGASPAHLLYPDSLRRHGAST